MPNKTATKALTPAKTRQVAASTAKKKSEKFIEVLKTDHHYDIVAEIIQHMAEIKRAKKIKPLEKHRLLKDYNLTLLSYCLPRIKIQENIGDDTGKGVVFNINLSGDDPGSTGTLKKAGTGKGKKKRTKSTGAHVTINTTKNKDGSFSVTE